MIKTGVIGASGYIGRHLLASYRQEYPCCVGTSFSARQASLVDFDIRQADVKSLRLEESGHQSVILASAQANIKYSEENTGAARAVNVDGTLRMLRQIAHTSLSGIFLSSDTVYAGTPGPHTEADPRAPGTVYGQHKMLVEDQVEELGDKFLTLRLSKIFGLQKGDGTLLDEMANQLYHGRTVAAAYDQVFCPLFIDDLVTAVHAVQKEDQAGTINVCGVERWSRYDMATKLAARMGVDASLVKRISLHDIPPLSNRPLDTSMVCSRVGTDVTARFTPFGECIDRVAANWCSTR